MTVHINVWSCCGIFGWYCPWPEWQRDDAYIRPAYDGESDYIYLYSLVGQMDITLRSAMKRDAEQQTWRKSPHVLGTVCIDSFVRPDGKVDWSAIRAGIIDVHHQAIVDRKAKQRAEEQAMREMELISPNEFYERFMGLTETHTLFQKLCKVFKWWK